MFGLDGGTIFLLALYFTPTLCVRRGSGRGWAMLAINLLLGWTFVGWVAALVLALWPVKNGG